MINLNSRLGRKLSKNLRKVGNSMAPLINKVALVTGASRGIGRAIAERLGRDGASVVINYTRSADKAQEVVAAIEARGGQALAVQADMSQIADIRRLFQKTVDHFGQLDILVNNAGNTKMKSIAEVTEEDFDAVFALNAKGILFALQEAARRMANGGRIVNISSSVTIYIQAGMALYSGSKGAVEQFTQVAAKELGERGITVNSVLPGPTDTELFSKTAPGMKEQEAQSSPFGRIGTSEDIADVVACLVSKEARWVTGQHILANGGATY